MKMIGVSPRRCQKYKLIRMRQTMLASITECLWVAIFEPSLLYSPCGYFDNLDPVFK